MKIKIKFLILLYALAVVVYIGVLLFNQFQSEKNRQNLRSLSALRELASLVDQDTISPSSIETLPFEETIEEDKTSTESIPALNPAQILPQYQELFEKNQDIIGWIKIEGTEVDYPVMYTPMVREFYLYRDFDKQDSKFGLPFVDYRSSIIPRTTNVLIHAHNMKDGSMFATLAKYQSRSFFENHPIVQFDSIVEKGEYEIFAAFMTSISSDEQDFKYYKFIQADTEKDFNDYVQNSLKLSIYDTGVVPLYGDQLLTLSTCSYHVNEGRMVVVARRIDNKRRGGIS